jgi:hypothetical protein
MEVNLENVQDQEVNQRKLATSGKREEIVLSPKMSFRLKFKGSKKYCKDKLKMLEDKLKKRKERTVQYSVLEFI